MCRKLLLGCFLVILLCVVGAYFAFRQFTRLPDWYADSVAEFSSTDRDPVSDSVPSSSSSESSGSRDDGSSSFAPDQRSASRSGGQVPSSTNGRKDERGAQRPATVDELRQSRGRVELDERQLSDLLVQSLDEHRNGRRVRKAAKAVRASFHGDRLEVGVVTSLDALEAASESGRESEVIRRLGRVAPWLKGREFYIAARGKPQARNGNLYFDRDLELVLGGIGLNAADTAERLGVSRSEIDNGAELPLGDIYLEGVEVDGESMVLSFADR